MKHGRVSGKSFLLQYESSTIILHAHNSRTQQSGCSIVRIRLKTSRKTTFDHAPIVLSSTCRDCSGSSLRRFPGVTDHTFDERVHGESDQIILADALGRPVPVLDPTRGREIDRFGYIESVIETGMVSVRERYDELASVLRNLKHA